MLKHITKMTQKDGKINYYYYTGKTTRRYTEKDNLPNTMIKILVDGECYETKYTEYGKIERFK